VLPPSLNFRRPNPQIDFESSPFYVNTTSREWPRGGGPRRAGVSSFGLGGTNAHVVLEEAPEREAGEASSRPVQVLTLSAKTEAALLELAGRYEGVVVGLEGAGLADACWTANTGRAQLRQRTALRHHPGELHAFGGRHRDVPRGTRREEVLMQVNGDEPQRIGRPVLVANPALAR